MIKIAHESPKSIFNSVQTLTDYDYALVHLFEQDSEYFKLFEDAIKDGREVILDNSIFELGEAFDPLKFTKWVELLKPSWFIVPDSLEDMRGTIDRMREWNEKYNNSLPGKKIGVVQGKNYDEIVACYKFMNNQANVDMIAISFDYSFYESLAPTPNKYLSWMLGRIQLLSKMMEDGVINTNMRHHLLGVGLPQEGVFYKNFGWDWIYSIDTSNPVVHGLMNIEYGDYGLWDKESTKLHTMINATKPDWDTWSKNIVKFSQYWNG